MHSERSARAARTTTYAKATTDVAACSVHHDGVSPDRVDKRHTLSYDRVVKPFRWSPEQNEHLWAVRGVGFETVVIAIETGGLLDVLAHTNPRRYPRQRIAVVDGGGYALLVPYVKGEDHIFLKTVIPSRKATRIYLGGRDDA